MTNAVILIVDDDPTTLRLCQRLLERAAYETVTALDPAKALQILEERSVDLLLSDIRMPVIDGFELIQRAKVVHPNLPVLVMTGYGSIENAIQALHRGVDGLILKPFEKGEELICAVERVLEESEQRRNVARLQTLRPLFHVTEKLFAERSPEPLEILLLDAMAQLFHAVFTGIYHWNKDEKAIEAVRVSGSLPFERKVDLQMQLLQSISADFRPTIVHPGVTFAAGSFPALLADLRWASVLVAPVGGSDSGLVFCAACSPGSPVCTEADLEMFVILAHQGAAAMENARLYSALKENVRQIEDSQWALIQAEKMSAVGRLMASLAHEINNPLQSVRNCLHLAARKGLAARQRMKYLQMTDQEVERLVSTVRRMLDFYRPSGTEKQRCNIRKIIAHVLALLDPQMRDQNVTVHFDAEAPAVQVYVAPDQIQQVIFNIVINALDMFEEMEPSNRPREIWITICPEEDDVRIQIEDSGTGVPIEMRERIFEPFVSTKAQGTGLGLSVSYGIMEQHQGNLAVVASRYGKGACFEIQLPFPDGGLNGENINC